MTAALRSALVATVAALAIWPAAGAESCPAPAAPPRVTFTPVMPTVSYDFDKSADELAAQSAEIRSPGGNDSIPVHRAGLTVAPVTIDAQSSWRSSESGDGTGLCAVLLAVEVRAGIPESVIHVASELEPGSCLYEEVLEHERRHAAINSEAVEAYAPRFEAALQEAMRGLGGLRAADQASLQAKVNEALQPALERILAAFKEDLTRRHAALDTPEEYRRVSQACGGDAGRVFGPSGAVRPAPF